MNTITPEDAGLSASRLNRIGAVVQRYVDDGKLPGVIATVARHGRIVYRERFGMMDVEAGKPMRLDTMFRVYSVTKAITSVALMMLYEEGRLQLHDPVSEFIPEFAHVKVLVGTAKAGRVVSGLDREITAEHLLTHTDGFTYDFFDDSPVVSMNREQASSIALAYSIYRERHSSKSLPRSLWSSSLVMDVATVWQPTCSVA
jgi:CubicO group peptidase (beta-lactamase class C family)